MKESSGPWDDCPRQGGERKSRTWWALSPAQQEGNAGWRWQDGWGCCGQRHGGKGWGGEKPVKKVPGWAGPPFRPLEKQVPITRTHSWLPAVVRASGLLSTCSMTVRVHPEAGLLTPTTTETPSPWGDQGPCEGHPAHPEAETSQGGLSASWTLPAPCPTPPRPHPPASRNSRGPLQACASVGAAQRLPSE